VPSGHVTVTNYIGGARAPHLAESDLETLINLTMHDLRVLLGIKGVPTFVHHALFRHAIPQYDVGYGRFKDLMTEIEQSAPGLFFAGHYRDGVALSDSIVSGDNAAKKVNAFVTAAIANHESSLAA